MSFLSGSQTFSVPVNFEFDPCPIDHEVNGMMEKCSFLRSKVDLKPGDNALLLGQPYRVSLALKIPGKQRNHPGMFMTCLRFLPEIRDKQPRRRESCRSAMLPYKSEYREMVESFVLAPAQLIGLDDGTETAEIEFFSDFRDDFREPVKAVEIEIKSRMVDVYE